MKKCEFIEKYGIESYENYKQSQRERYYKNQQTIKEQNKTYRINNRKNYTEWFKNYRNTQKGRANYLIQSYKRKDKKYRNTDCTITSDFIVNEIFTKSCVYCGETDWRKLGCDRIDNSKPHTPYNVVCSCKNCNIKRQKEPFINFLTSSSNYYPIQKR